MVTTDSLKDYFDKARRFDQDRMASAERSRRLAWFVAVVASVLACVSVTAVVALTPLKTVEPFVIRVDNSTGIVDVVSAMHMYHSWGSQNAWLRQITNRNYLYVSRELAAESGLKDEDWVWITSHHGRVKAPIRTMAGVNRHTVWTWNAIGKRKGAWGLDNDAPESNQGFLLNHVISDLLPEKGGGYRYANADPVTGQAAWYDLRVRLEKCADAEAGETVPMQDPVAASKSRPAGPAVQRFGGGIKDRPSGDAPVVYREWIAHRDSVAENVEGIAPGHGNKIETEKADQE